MKLYKAIRFLMLSGILTLVSCRGASGSPWRAALWIPCYDLPTSLTALPLTFSESVFRG